MLEKFNVDLVVNCHLERLKEDILQIVKLSKKEGEQQNELINFIKFRQFGSLIVEYKRKQEKLDIEKEKPLYIVNYGEFISDLSNLEGQVLTSIDSSFENERQCKATKDLIKKRFFSFRGNLMSVWFNIRPETIKEAYYMGKLNCMCDGDKCSCNYCGGKNEEKLKELNK